MTNILSFDCAIKRLGVCYVKTNMNVKDDITHELMDSIKSDDPKKQYGNIVNLIDTANQILWMDNVDLTPGKKVGDVNQLGLAEALHTTLMHIDTIADKCDVVLIECQPNRLNNRSSIICGQLIYHYTNRKHVGKCAEVHVVQSSWKNKISLGPNLSLETFKKKNYSSNYTCNKAHSRENFKYWTSLFGYSLTTVKKPITDIADAFMQVMAWKEFHSPDSHAPT